MTSVVFINHMGEKLSGTLHRPKVSNEFGFDGLGFVMGHCFTCSRHTRILVDLSTALAELGICVLRFDFSGNGKSEGRFEDSTYTKQIEEIADAADFMKKNGSDRVLIGGHSMGGMVSLFTAAKRDDIIGVIVLAPGATTLHPDRLLTVDQKKILIETDQVAFSSRGRDLILTRDFFDDAADYDIKTIIKQIRCPVLAVLAAEDTVLDPAAAKTVFVNRHQNLDLLEVAGADHMFSRTDHRQTIIAYVEQWIKNQFLTAS